MHMPTTYVQDRAHTGRGRDNEGTNEKAKRRESCRFVSSSSEEDDEEMMGEEAGARSGRKGERIRGRGRIGTRRRPTAFTAHY
jgi:hypothetical protein